MKHTEDYQLIKQIISKANRESAELLVERYYKEIYSFCYRQTGNKDIAMDLTQEIFITVLQSLANFNHRKASFRTWLYRIASNRVVDYFRSSQYKFDCISINVDDVLLPSDNLIEERMLQEEQLEMALKALAELPFLQQQIVRLKLFGDKTFSEIGLSLGISENTVKTKYYSALKQIRRRVE